MRAGGGASCTQPEVLIRKETESVGSYAATTMHQGPAATAEPTSTAPDDYLARLNMEGGRKVWLGNRPKIDFVLRRAASHLKPGHAVCDVGIGDGYLLDRLEDLGMHCVGVDVSEYLVDFHRRRVREQGRKTRFVHANIADLQVDAPQFHAVFCLDILEHLSEADCGRALVSIRAMLCPGGTLIGSVPFRENLEQSMVCCPACAHRFHRVGHHQAFDYAKIRDTLSPGFELESFGLVRVMRLESRRQKLSHALCLPVRKIRQLYYSRCNPLGELRPGDTCYFIATRT